MEQTYPTPTPVGIPPGETAATYKRCIGLHAIRHVLSKWVLSITLARLPTKCNTTRAIIQDWTTLDTKQAHTKIREQEAELNTNTHSNNKVLYTHKRHHSSHQSTSSMPNKWSKASNSKYNCHTYSTQQQHQPHGASNKTPTKGSCNYCKRPGHFTTAC